MSIAVCQEQATDKWVRDIRFTNLVMYIKYIASRKDLTVASRRLTIAVHVHQFFIYQDGPLLFDAYFHKIGSAWVQVESIIHKVSSHAPELGINVTLPYRLQEPVSTMVAGFSHLITNHDSESQKITYLRCLFLFLPQFVPVYGSPASGQLPRQVQETLYGMEVLII